MLHRLHAENAFITGIKNNIVYESVDELELPQTDNQDIKKKVHIFFNFVEKIRITLLFPLFEIYLLDNIRRR